MNHNLLLPPFCPVRITIDDECIHDGSGNKLPHSARHLLDEIGWRADYFQIEHSNWMPWVHWALIHCTPFGEGVVLSDTLRSHASVPEQLRRRFWAIWFGGGAFGSHHLRGPGPANRANFSHPLLDESHKHWRTHLQMFRACCTESAARRLGRPTSGISLNRSGDSLVIRVSDFEFIKHRQDSQFAQRIDSWNQRPLASIVVARSERDALLRFIEGRHTDPDVRPAIEEAIRRYQFGRAPLRPLPAAMRIGYLDEVDWITCTSSFREFAAGTKYRVSPVQCNWARDVQDVSAKNESFFATRHGTETGFRVDSTLFVPPHILAPGVHVAPTPAASFVDLVQHFEIPEVADVTQAIGASYQSHLEALSRIEAATESLNQKA